MNLRELIEQLEDLEGQLERDGVGEIDGTVMVAQQPSWPVASRVQAVTYVNGRIFIACGEAREYAPRAAWEGGVVEDDDEE